MMNSSNPSRVPCFNTPACMLQGEVSSSRTPLQRSRSPYVRVSAQVEVNGHDMSDQLGQATTVETQADLPDFCVSLSAFRPA